MLMHGDDFVSWLQERINERIRAVILQRQEVALEDSATTQVAIWIDARIGSYVQALCTVHLAHVFEIDMPIRVELHDCISVTPRRMRARKRRVVPMKAAL